MSQKIYGYGTNPDFTPADLPFLSAGQDDGWLNVGDMRIFAAVQDDVQSVYQDEGTWDLLLEIPGGALGVPIGATGITVTFGFAAGTALGSASSGDFRVKTGGVSRGFGAWASVKLYPYLGIDGLVSDATTRDGNNVAFTGSTFLTSLFGFRAIVPASSEVSINKFGMSVVYTDPSAGLGLSSTQIIGTTARLGVARLGASRLGAAPDRDALRAGGIYRWSRNTSNSPKAVPPNATSAAWTKTRPPG